MKYECDMVRDLLPLYHDSACSSSSRQIVEEHLSECSSCKSIFTKMKDSTLDSRFKDERENVVGNYAKKVKRKSLTVGLGISGILAIPIIVCLIVNLATGHALDWFFIVLTSLMVLGSLIVVPLVVDEKEGLWTIGSFTISLLLLLMTCCLYSGGNWFFVAAAAILFGLSVILLPYIIGQLPLKGFLSGHKGLIVMLTDTLLFYVLIIACGVYGKSAAYWPIAFPVTVISLIFPWFLFVIIRYVKINGLLKSGICVIFSGFFLSLYQDIMDWIMDGVIRISVTDADFRYWNTDLLINANIWLLILMVCCITGAALLTAGLFRRQKK